MNGKSSIGIGWETSNASGVSWGVWGGRRGLVPCLFAALVVGRDFRAGDFPRRGFGVFFLFEGFDCVFRCARKRKPIVVGRENCSLGRF